MNNRIKALKGLKADSKDVRWIGKESREKTERRPGGLVGEELLEAPQALLSSPGLPDLSCVSSLGSLSIQKTSLR